MHLNVGKFYADRETHEYKFLYKEIHNTKTSIGQQNDTLFTESCLLDKGSELHT